MSRSQTHEDRVQQVVEQLLRWNHSGRKNKLRTARPTFMGMNIRVVDTKKGSNLIKTSHLDYILELDEKNMTLRTESAVTMGQITEFLNPKGYALQCQVEMESITAGGNTMGFGIETNSHIYGLFQESVVEYEMILSDGTVKLVTEESDRDLFFALPWSVGTLGFLGSVKLKIIKIKPFIKLTYIPTYSLEEYNQKMTELVTKKDTPDFLEATLFSKDTAVIQAGQFAEPQNAEDKAKINSINYWFKPFFFRHCETYLHKKQDYEFIPVNHYYHRFTRSIFWELEDMIPFSNHWMFRLFWGWMGPPEVSLLKLIQTRDVRKLAINAHACQESIMPLRKLEEGVKNFDQWFGIYPLLSFPIKIYDRGEKGGFLNPLKKENLVPGQNYGYFIDIGAYGEPKLIKEGKWWDAKKVCREMEHWTRDNGGYQAICYDYFCTPKEFRKMYNHTLLDEQKQKLGATDAFCEPFDKIKPEDGMVDLTEELEKEKRE